MDFVDLPGEMGYFASSIRGRIAAILVQIVAYAFNHFISHKGGRDMATYFMFGKYSAEALKGISAERTHKAAELIKKFGGEITAMYALLGENDLVLIVDFPNTDQVMKASVALNRLTGISFATCPAVTVEEFDRLMTEV